MSVCIFCNRILTENIYSVYESINSTVLPYKDIQKLIPKTKLATLNHICIHCLYLVRVLNGFIEQLQNLIKNKSCINYSDAFDTFKGQINAINYNNSNQNNNSPEEDHHSYESEEVEESNEEITQNVVNFSDEESDGEQSNKDSELVVATHIVDYVENDTRRYTPASMEIQRALSRKRRNTKDDEEELRTRSRSPYSCRSTSMHVTVNDDGASISDVLRCTSTKLREPMYNRRNVEDFRYPCTLKKCSYKYESYDQLESHVITTHSKAEQDIFFGQDYIKSYKAHMREEAQKVKLAVQPVYKGVLAQPRYSCDIDDCNATFRSLMKLSDHKRSQHNLMSLYKCSDCSLRAFTSQKDLDLHTEEAHYDIVVNCYYCAQQISNQLEWNYHMTMHPQFCCKYCDSYFLDADVLKRHCREHYGRKNKKEYRQNTILKRIDIESDYTNPHILCKDSGEFVRIRLQPGRRESPLPEYICDSLESTTILSDTEVSDTEQELRSCDNSTEDVTVTSVSEVDADSITTINDSRHQNIEALTDALGKDPTHTEENIIVDDSSKLLTLVKENIIEVLPLDGDKGDNYQKTLAEQIGYVSDACNTFDYHQRIPSKQEKGSESQIEVESSETQIQVESDENQIEVESSGIQIEVESSETQIEVKNTTDNQDTASSVKDKSRTETSDFQQETKTFDEGNVENNTKISLEEDYSEAHTKTMDQPYQKESEIKSIIASNQDISLTDNKDIDTETMSQSVNDQYISTEIDKVDAIEVRDQSTHNDDNQLSTGFDNMEDQKVTEVKILDQNVSKRYRKNIDDDDEEFRIYMNKCDIKFKKAIVIVEDCKGFIDEIILSKAMTSKMDFEAIDSAESRTIAVEALESTKQNIEVAESSGTSALEVIEPEDTLEKKDVPELQSYLRVDDSEIPNISAEIEISKATKKGRLKNKRETDYESQKQGKSKRKTIVSHEENVVADLAKQSTTTERIATESPTPTEMSDMQTNRKKRVRRPPKKYEQDNVVQFKKEIHPNVVVGPISIEAKLDVVEDETLTAPESFTEETASIEKFKKGRKGKARRLNSPAIVDLDDKASIITKQRKKRKTEECDVLSVPSTGRRKKKGEEPADLADTSDKVSGHSGSMSMTPEPVTPRKRLGMTNITKRLGRYRH